ncbi:MAG TPA: Rrf2 family transcriptional regulator [Aliidongia sp.]|uniref:Rrf2 family transcriptional regulator n=1 Tax=Aliidongia sp. TaxID=1914230 RepID=UPI002DDC9786|nr:Rrf2 family transcriptional regulator [Aliidongia sp.]HEV2676439.1 Rrf2 family transcriptional regulator [Aliidongia sp.]
MKLTLLTDYALRTLIFVGTKQGELSTIGEIAAAFDISKTHLMKVVHKLGQCGYLENIRGKNGGIRLRRRPEEIGIGDVVRAIEEDLAVIGCMTDERFCRIQSTCVLQGALHEATRAFLAALDAYNLADLLAPRAQLAQVLGLLHPSGFVLSGRRPGLPS